MIASSPSGATVRSQSAEITPAPAFPPLSSSLELVRARWTGLAEGGETKVTAAPSWEEATV